MNAWTDFWKAGKVFKASFDEQQVAIKAIYETAGKILHVPPGTPFTTGTLVCQTPDTVFPLQYFEHALHGWRLHLKMVRQFRERHRPAFFEQFYDFCQHSQA